LNELLRTINRDYIIAIDTDSVYVNMGRLVDKFSPKNPVDFLDKVAKQKIEPYINKSYKELADMMNAYEQKMFMDREVIADKGIWTAKKRYVLNVYDNEGVRYTEPKLKVMGLETVKSSTPQVVRTALEKALKLILTTDEETVQKFIKDFKEEFKTLPFEDVAFPRSVSELKKWEVKTESFAVASGTPIHVRGAILHNYLLKVHNIKRIEPIKEGDKVKFSYMKTPNPLKQNVLSIINSLPKEFGVEDYIDYDIQFDKSFVEPLKAILDCIDWSVERQTTLESFFV